MAILEERGGLPALPAAWRIERTQGRDGYVSIEVSPHLAYDTEGSIAQAREF